MKIIKWLSIVFISSILFGCGGHGFEGEFSSDFAGKMTIGPDYIENNGQRQNFDEIFVRESDNKEYLVFKLKEAEEAWEIIDDDHLVKRLGKRVIMKLERIK